MSGKTEEVKGRIKEAAGILSGNKKLSDAGRADQVSGKVKQAEEAEQAVLEAKENALKAQDAAQKALCESKDDAKECATDCE